MTDRLKEGGGPIVFGSAATHRLAHSGAWLWRRASAEAKREHKGGWRHTFEIKQTQRGTKAGIKVQKFELLLSFNLRVLLALQFIKGSHCSQSPPHVEHPSWSWGGTCKSSLCVRLPPLRQQSSTLTHTDDRLPWGLSLVAGFHALLPVCVHGAETLDTLTLVSSFPSVPSSSTPLCCLSCPPFPPLTH